MRETALAYVRHGGNAVAMAAELHVHPQTARYRIARLRELFGDDLDDPDAASSSSWRCAPHQPEAVERRDGYPSQGS